MGGREPPFKIAAFFNCVMLFSPSDEIGSDIGKEVRKMEGKHAAFLEGRAVEAPTADKNESETNNAPYKNIYRFPADTFPVRISIPTLHVLGTEDQFEKYSQELIKLCQPDRTEVVAFEGGHEIPRSEVVLQKCWNMFELVVMMASFST
jgi:hypothetical protein